MFFFHHLILSSHHEERRQKSESSSSNDHFLHCVTSSVGARGDSYRKTLMEQAAMRWAYNQVHSKFIIIDVIFNIIILNKESFHLDGCNANKYAPHSCDQSKAQSLRLIIFFQDNTIVINLLEYAIPATAATQKGVSLGVCGCYKEDHV